MIEWQERPVDAKAVADLAAAGASPLMARLLALRGIEPEGLEKFFSPDWRDLAAPRELPGVENAAKIIYSYLARDERIVVFGDYDCDGLCATAIMTLALRRIRAEIAPGLVKGKEQNIFPFLPERLGEGYGLTDGSVARMLSKNPDVKLVVTVDNGVNAVEQIEALKQNGIEVVVTDHHLRGETLPAAAAIVNPKVEAPRHLQDLCGAAVAYFLANELVEIARQKSSQATIAKGLGGTLFTLAGLATVTDIMPLSEQNRIFVAEALRHFPRWAPIGLRELHAHAARTGVEAMSSKDFGFLLGPRINAVGRLDSGDKALELLLCPECERERSRTLAIDVDLYTSQRRQIEQRMSEAAMAQIVPGAPAQIIAFDSDNPDVHPGVAGIVASRILEKLSPQVPVCVLVDGKGSSRAPAGYNVRDALSSADDELLHYGGHAVAAGLAVKSGRLEEFKAIFTEACVEQAANLPPADTGVRFVDAELEPKDITLDFAEDIARMEPFGEGNSEPVFVLRNVNLAQGGVRQLGATGNHLQLAFRERNLPRAVWWGHGDMVEDIRAWSASPYDLLFNLTVSEYGGRHVEINLVDLRPVR